jgi:RNA 2',3'-cyclic 3'-phosphodiesterase
VRLFVALELPDAVRRELRLHCEVVLPQRAGLRVTDPALWHVTLAFYGEVDDSLLEPLGSRLQRAAARHPSPTLQLAGAGQFGGRVLWAGVGGEVAAVRRLFDSVAAAGRREGLDVDHRRYRPHVTLARSAVVSDLREMAAGFGDWQSSTWTADAISLFRSDLGPLVRHTVLATWPLAR